MFRLPRKKNKGSAKSQIGIKEVRDDILILSDNSYRSILSTSSLNFELQSEEEQDALIDTFQSFLNALTRLKPPPLAVTGQKVIPFDSIKIAPA